MMSRFFFEPTTFIFVIGTAFAMQQVGQSAEPVDQLTIEQGETGLPGLGSDAQGTDNGPGSNQLVQALPTTIEQSDISELAAHILEQGSEYGAETRALLVEPLMKLAMIEKQSGKNLQAERTSELAIELIERNGGVFDAALVEPLVFLAQLKQEGGDHPGAIEMLNRAQHILHRADGVMTGLQLPILEQMISNFSAMEKDDEAGMVTELVYAINVRHLDKHSLEFVPFILKQAEFKAKSWQFRAARELYLDALEILEQYLPDNDPDLVDALNGIATVRYKEQSYGIPGSRLIARGRPSTKQAKNHETQSTREIGKIRMREKAPIASPYQGRKEGTRTLQKVIAIMDEHPQRFSAIQRAEAYIRLGDWNMLIRRPRLANDAYRSAWHLLADEVDAASLLAANFGQPKKLKYSRPSLPNRGPGMYENYDGRFVAVSYSVNEDGAVRNLRFVDSNSPKAMNVKMRDAVKRAIYRPRYIDAQPVVTDDLFLREEFSGTAYLVH
jgi:tetratricopeptide (TPR) repeat protein